MYGGGGDWGGEGGDWGGGGLSALYLKSLSICF